MIPLHFQQLKKPGYQYSLFILSQLKIKKLEHDFCHNRPLNLIDFWINLKRLESYDHLLKEKDCFSSELIILPDSVLKFQIIGA